jgi:hypothetical protein
VGDYDHLIVVELVERHHVKAVAVPAGLRHQGHSLAEEKMGTATNVASRNVNVTKRI